MVVVGKNTMKTFLRHIGMSSSRSKYVVEISDNLLAGCYEDQYFVEDLRRILEKRRKESGTPEKILLVDSGAKPWMKELLPGELTFVPVHLGPFHLVPSLVSLFEVVADMTAWLQAGVGSSERPVILIVASSMLTSEIKSLATVALLIVCYLNFMDLYEDGARAMEFFRKKITDGMLAGGREQLKLKIEVTNTLHYINTFDVICRNGVCPNGVPLVLRRIRISGGVTLPGLQRWHPVIQFHPYSIADGAQKDYERITLGGHGDEENATIADSFAVFNVNVLTYGDFLLSFEHWIPLIDQMQPLFSIARHTSVIQPPVYDVDTGGLEIAPGQARGLTFDSNFMISLDFEPVDVADGVFSEDEIRLIERVERELDTIEEIASQSRRAVRQRAVEAAERRAQLQTALPSGNQQSIGLGLNLNYPQTDIGDALETLPEEDLSAFLHAFKVYQNRNQNDDDIAALLAESGFSVDEDDELFIDQAVDEEDIDDAEPEAGELETGFDANGEQDSALQPASLDDDVRLGDEETDEGSSDSEESESESSESTELQTKDDAPPDAFAGSDETSFDREKQGSEENEKELVNEFIRVAMWRVAETEKMDLRSTNVSWLELSGHVHAALLQDVNRKLVELYSKAYKKPVTLAKKLRQLCKETLVQEEEEKEANAKVVAQLDLPPPAPEAPEMPDILLEAWEYDALPDLVSAAGLVRRSSSTVKVAESNGAPSEGLVLRRSTLNEGTTEKKELRQLHWNKISDKIVNQSAFAMAAPKIELFTSLEEGSKEIDNLFGASARAAAEQKPCTVKSAGVLTDKRLMNLEIMLNKFPDDIQTILDGLAHLDPNGKKISDEKLQVLTNAGITGEEIKAARATKLSNDELQELTRADKYVILTSRLPGWARKVRAASTLRSFKAVAADVETSAKNLLETSARIRHNESFKSFVAVVLSIGNVLNEGTRKGDARGFRLDALPKLADVRSKEKNLSLLHYVIRVAKQSDADATSFVHELGDVRPAMKNSREELKGMVQNLSSTISELREEVEEMLQLAGQNVGVEGFEGQPQCPDDTDLALSAKRCLLATKRASTVEGVVAAALGEFEEMAGYLGENPKRVKIEDAFGTLSTFFDLVVKCSRELEVAEEEAAKKS